MSHVEELQLQDIYTLMNERHSVRSYDPTVKISREEMTEMLELSATAPSSSNLQPWRFLVIDDADLKQKLLPIANNQQQVIEASAVIAVLGDLRSFEQAEAIYSKSVEGGFMTEEIKQGFVERLQKTYGGLPPERLHLINTFDAGLITMQLMLVAKAKGYDTVPMGGYNAEKFAEAFELPETLKPILLLAIGKAAKPAHSTPRLPVEQVTYWNTFK
ncbi:nitroreductase family protein [Paenibacillus anaericanus]|uniref:Nitroreductase family protein n=1 Tax=Paenibacillus anaericanus TaxID=170367 RepID=A0A3S1EEB5_9BACL|nr:nitroreductase family protein [Paenibacillus anaericanus]RUT43803.1 nitroreductase family protein [Paenibacillus anaericanus]